MSELTEKSCVPCRGGVPSLSKSEIDPLLAQLNGWEVVDLHHLTKNFEFDGFVDGLAFVNALGELAEREGHHPDLQLSWGRVQVDIWTHKIDGLTESDFVLAAKADAVLLKPVADVELSAEAIKAGDCGCGCGCDSVAQA